MVADFSLSRLIEDYLEELFNEKNVSFVTRQKLWNIYNEKLSKAVDVGYSPDLDFYDEDLAKSLKDNIAEFSAFKETSFKKEVESLLTDGKHLRSKSDFKKEALKVSDDYNYRWLETERHHTIAVANMTSKLKDFEQNVELYPNLKLVSVNDSRVRPEHKVLDGTVRPFNDPFWQSHTPPLDWGCRCDLEQTDDDVTEVPGGLQTKIEFENNPVDSGKIFGGSAYEENLTKDEKQDAEKLIDYNYLHQNKDFENTLERIRPEQENAYPNLDKEQSVAVNFYSREYYDPINKYNRGLETFISEKGGYTDDFYKSITKTINKAVDDIPDKHVGMTYRGTYLDDLSVLDDYKKAFETGKVHTEKTFMSTSIDQTEAFEGNVTFSVKSKTGAKISKLSASPHEQEVLFKAGQKFKVTGFTDYGEAIHIEMEEI